MNKAVPFKKDFTIVNCFERAGRYILLLSTLLLILSYLLDTDSPNCKAISDCVDRINCILIVGYATIEIYIDNFGFFNSSVKKREDFMDNSFNCSIGIKKSENYFSNNKLEASVYKMGVNCFENNLFSYHIAKEMLPIKLVKCITICLIIIGCAICGYDNTIILLIQLILPILLIKDTIKHAIFVNRLEKNLKSFCRIFNHLKNGNKNAYIPEVICNVMDYEAILTWGSIILDSKIFNSLNPSLSKEWESMKNEYNIK